MDEQKRPRAWVYARIPGDYDGTMNSYKVCSMQALHDGCDIVGGSIDERGGWLLRPGYRDMLRQIKAGKVDRVYICRMRQISGKERHLYFLPLVCGYEQSCRHRSRRHPFQVMRSIQEHLGS